MEQDQRQELGQRLRQRREEVGLTQAQVGELAEINRATVRTVETGKPIGLRTLANIKRVVGCSARFSYAARNEADGDWAAVSPVLSAKVVRIIGHGLLSVPADQRASAVQDYFSVIQALAEREDLDPGEEPMPIVEGFDRWLTQLRAYLPEVDMRTVELELRENLGVDNPDPGQRLNVTLPPGAETAPACRPETQTIINSGLPASQQGALFEYLGRRREQPDLVAGIPLPAAEPARLGGVKGDVALVVAAGRHAIG